jgi:homoserine dehydrogenase
MLGDLVDASRNLLAGAPAPAPKRTSTTVFPQNDLHSAFYLSLDVADRPGVLAAVARIFGDHDVSIRAMEQVGLADEARLIFLTHLAREGDLLATIDELRRHQAVDRVSGVLRVIGERADDEGGDRS